MSEQTIITHQTLTSFTEQLPSERFIRIHKSFMVAIAKIDLIEGNRIHIENEKLPIGKIYSQNVLNLIK